VEDLLIWIAGADEILTRAEVEHFIKKAEFPENEIDEVIDLLCDTTFLGIETKPDQFEFIYDENRKRVLQRLAQRTADSCGQTRFRINIPFHLFLSINPCPPKKLETKV
jgi:hypothetical protein